MSKYKVLLADDDKMLTDAMADFLQMNGYETVWAYDGLSAIEKFRTETPDFVILDISMPDKDGYEVLKAIRATDPVVPIFFLTGSKIGSFKQLNAYSMGIYDYLEKPIIPEMLLAKIKVWQHFKREYKKSNTEYKVQKYTFNLNSRLLVIENNPILLTEKQAQVLHILLKNTNNVVKKKDILLSVWKNNIRENEQMMRNTIKELRTILSSLENIQLSTVYGSGYILKEKGGRNR